MPKYSKDLSYEHNDKNYESLQPNDQPDENEIVDINDDKDHQIDKTDVLNTETEFLVYKFTRKMTYSGYIVGIVILALVVIVLLYIYFH